MVKEWRTATIRDVSTIFGRIGFRGYTKKDIVDFYEGAISLSPSNLKDGKIMTDNSTFISWDKYNESPEIKIQIGDVVLVKTGSTYGKSAYVDSLTRATTLNPQIVVFKNIKINSKLFAYLIQTPEFKKQINSTVVGGAIPTLSQNQVYRFQIVFPKNSSEQQRIAEALSDVDGMISSLEKLVAKYKSIKTACLQQMFPQNGETVPRMRLPGFTDAWEQRKLVNLCEKFTDGDWIEAKDQSNSGVRLIQTGNVGLGEYIDKPTNKKWISEETFERLNCEEVFAGDILISRLPEPAGRACIVPNLGTKMITAVDCTIIRTATQINSKYLLQYLSSQSYFDEVNTCLAGGTRQRISRSNLATFDIPMPAKYEEQKAIGEFLCGMDNLITLHQRKLEKIQKIKQGMMQQLLTGKIRLV